VREVRPDAPVRRIRDRHRSSVSALAGWNRPWRRKAPGEQQLRATRRRRAVEEQLCQDRAVLTHGIDCPYAMALYFHCFGNMKKSSAIDSLAALAQETRLNIFRLLVRNAPKGLPAGAIARRFHLPSPTLSFHLNVLAAADLIHPHKNGRSISYSAKLEAVNRLAEFLMEDCCGGQDSCVAFVDLKNDVGTERSHRKAPAKQPRRR